MAWEAAVTNAGNALFARWASGGTLSILGASAGTGSMDSAALLAATAIEGEVQELSITGCRLVDGGVRYAVQFAAADAAYTARQIGIWASLDGGERTLIAIYQSAEGIPVESKADMPDYIYEFGAIVEMRNDGDLQVNIDTSALASQRDIQAMVRTDVEQAFSEDEKARGRSNIGAASTALFTATIPTEGWTEGTDEEYFSCTIEIAGMLESDIPIWDLLQTGKRATDDPMRDAAGAIVGIGTRDGAIIVRAEEIPAVEIPIQIKVVR